jgi:hypothetical protein
VNTNQPSSNANPAVPAPPEFAYLDHELDNHIIEDQTPESLSDGKESVSAVTKEAGKIIKQIASPSVGIVSVSLGSVLLFSQTVYNALAMLMGLGLGSQKLDPATLLDYWEREGKKRSRDDGENRLEGMFG